MKQKITKLEDLQKLVNLSDLQEIRLDNYLQTIADYEINEGEISCQCIEGRSSICKQKHKHGYVIQLKDNNFSIIGNMCVKKLGTDTQIRKDINAYTNARRRFERLESIKQYIENKESYIVKIQHIKREKNILKNQQIEFFNFMGNEFEKLEFASRTISITGISKRINITQNSPSTTEKKDVETIKTPFTIGYIRGLDSVISAQKYLILEEKISAFEKGLNNLTALLHKIEFDSYNPKETEINAYRRQLENLSELEPLVLQIKQDWQDFKSNNSEQMVFAYEKPYNFIRYLSNINKAEAKSFCASVEQTFKEVNKLDSISRIAMNLFTSSSNFDR